MNWQQVELISTRALEELRGRRNNRPYTLHSGPLIGGISPEDEEEVESYYIKAPTTISAEFEVKVTGKDPTVSISGQTLRQLRARLDPSEALSTVLEPVTFDEKSFEVTDGTKTESWFMGNTTQYVGSTRRQLRNDPGYDLRVKNTITKKEDAYLIMIEIKNVSDKPSVLYDFNFSISLDGCKLVRHFDKENIHENDIPMVVSTVNAVAHLENDEKKITLLPYGIFDQNRVVTTPGPTFDDALSKPFEGSLGKHQNDFEWAAKIATNAMKKLVKSANYHKFQFALRGIIYRQLIKGWEDNVLRAVVNNAPTASGKSETNFDSAVVATLVRKRQTTDGDCGTVAVITEPIRALTAEQFERLFRFIAYVNDQLEEKYWVTMGFFMGAQQGKGIPYEPTKEITIKDIPINDCPFCDKELSLEYVQEQGRLYAKCDNCNRNFPWIYLTRRETEVFLPNIVLATLDKLCYDEARNLGVHSFFGREYVRCPKNTCKRAISVTSKVIQGNGECWHCYSKVPDKDRKKSKLSLFILDEAHSFSGNLGSNAGLYTTTELHLARRALQESPLVIASTATVNKAAELLQHQTGSLKSETIILPDPNKEGDEEKYFTPSPKDSHRKFVFLCPNASNRIAIPKAIGVIKDAYDSVRGPEDPERLPQIVFTKKRQNADNLYNAIQILGEEEHRQLEVKIVHGEYGKNEIKAALQLIEERKIDVLFVTLDLIALGIDIPSISVIHFDGMPEDFAKFVQAYGRSARGQTRDDCGIVFTWLRMSIPGEAYYFEHYRDLFIYKKEMMPIIPINRWFPQSIRSFIPAAAFQYGFFTNERASMFSVHYSARLLDGPEDDYRNEVKSFLNDTVLSDAEQPEDLEIAKRFTNLGFQDIRTHIPKQSISSFKRHTQLLEKLIPSSIRSNSKETVISPDKIDRTLMSVRVERSLIHSGFSEYELGLGDEE